MLLHHLEDRWSMLSSQVPWYSIIAYSQAPHASFAHLRFGTCMAKCKPIGTSRSVPTLLPLGSEIYMVSPGCSAPKAIKVFEFPHPRWIIHGTAVDIRTVSSVPTGATTSCDMEQPKPKRQKVVVACDSCRSRKAGQFLIRNLNWCG